MGFKSGLDEIDKASEEAKQQQGNFSPKLRYRNFKDGDKLILRFLTDDVITAQFYDWVTTKRVIEKGDHAGEYMSQDFLVDPDGQDWVKMFGGTQREYGTNKVIQAKPRKQTVAVAVVREEVSAKGGKTEIVDKTVIFEHEGKKYKGREFVLIKQSLGNFWENFRGMTRRYQTICDRDYEITRRGSDKDTFYEIAPIDPVAELKNLKDLHACYGYGRTWNDDDVDRFLYCPQTLQEWAEDHSSEHRASYWLVGDEVTPTNGQVIDQDGNAEATPTGWGQGDDEAQAAPGKFGDFKDLIKSSK